MTVSLSQEDKTMSRLLQLSFWLTGILIISWAFFDPQFRDAEGFFEGNLCLPVSVGIAAIALGCAANGRFKNFTWWFALALVGQAVVLQMIEAGPLLRYQHYKPINRLINDNDLLFLTFLVAQTAIVLSGFIVRWRNIRVWISRNFRVWQLGGIGLMFLLSSATVSREVPSYIVEIAFATMVQAVNLGNIVLMVWAVPDEFLSLLQERFERWFGHSADDARGDSAGIDRFAVLAALWVTVLAAALSILVYENHPHIQDEVIYLYHARYLAEGVLTVPAPPVPEAFSLYMIPYEAERWYSIFPPGWPAMLAVGVFLGIPWLVNPMLAGLNVLLSYLFIREIYSLRIARLAVLLLCASPWFIFMGMNFMSHTFTLTCMLSASVAMARAKRKGKVFWGGLAGCATGMVSLIRPIDGAIVALLVGLWAIIPKVGRLKIGPFIGFIFGTVLVGSVILPYNQQITGDSTVFPLVAYYEKYFGPKTNAFGFGPERGLGWPIDPFPGHSPLDALINANLNVSSINFELFGWGTGSLVLIAVILLSKTLERIDYLMIAMIATVFGTVSLYWFSGGPDFGARYWYLMLIPLVVLAARGIEFLERSFDSGLIGSYHTHHGIRVVAAVLSLCIITLINYFPWRAIDKYHRYLGMRPDIRSLAIANGFGRSLVLIRGDRHPDYASTAAFNPLDPYADVPIYAWDQNPKVTTQVVRAYSDRPIWIVNGPSITRRGFQVLAGPLSAHDFSADGKLAQ